MGTNSFSILASDDGTFKAIGTIVVLIIWGIGAMASAAGKAKEAAKRKQLQAGAEMPPPLTPAPLQVAPPPLPPRRTTLGRTPVRRPVPPPLPLSSRPAAQPLALAGVPLPALIADAQQPPLSSVPVLSRPMIARPPRSPIVGGWINASTVRSNFILAEVLQPPLALRAKRNL